MVAIMTWLDGVFVKRASPLSSSKNGHLWWRKLLFKGLKNSPKQIYSLGSRMVMLCDNSISILEECMLHIPCIWIISIVITTHFDKAILVRSTKNQPSNQPTKQPSIWAELNRVRYAFLNGDLELLQNSWRTRTHKSRCWRREVVS